MNGRASVQQHRRACIVTSCLLRIGPRGLHYTYGNACSCHKRDPEQQYLVLVRKAGVRRQGHRRLPKTWRDAPRKICPAGSLPFLGRIDDSAAGPTGFITRGARPAITALVFVSCRLIWCAARPAGGAAYRARATMRRGNRRAARLGGQRLGQRALAGWGRHVSNFLGRSGSFNRNPRSSILCSRLKV